jgi:hypothetical protein
MKLKFNFLVCATIVATHWVVTGNAQIPRPRPEPFIL